MLSQGIQGIFDFIDFLEANKRSYIDTYLPICKQLEKLDAERRILRPNDNYRDKLQYNAVQQQIEEQFALVYDNVYTPITEKLRKLGLWSGDKTYISIKNNISSVTTDFKNNFQLSDVQNVVSYMKKYTLFRKETNSNFLTLELLLSDLDDVLKDLYDFFKDPDENEFESFESKYMECKSIEEALTLYADSSKRNIRFTLPSSFFTHSDTPNQREVETNLISKELSILKGKVKQLISSSADKAIQSSYEEAIYRVNILKSVIEDKGGFRIFKMQENQNEAMFQSLFQFVKEESTWDINAEVNNGRGPVDFTVSRGSKDKTVIEFKLAKSFSLRKNLKYQVDVYKKANSTDKAVIAILYFNQTEYKKLTKVIQELNLSDLKNVILIDGQQKLSASNVKN